MRPALLTFDVFGTIVDWRSGLRDRLWACGVDLTEVDFDKVVDLQAELEKGPFRAWGDIAGESLVTVLGMAPADAYAIAADAGRWPLFPDSRAALARLMRIAPCVALTNSDRVHGEAVQGQLGFRLTDWIGVDEARAYKPDPTHWRRAAERWEVPTSSTWWHVSAYADYDLRTARELGCTTVFVERPHRRPGPADVVVSDLLDLVTHLESVRDRDDR